jgi:Ni,Fe-hydrogenase maturation factor
LSASQARDQLDDAFGIFVAAKVVAMPLGPNIRVIDYGLRGIDLAFLLFLTVIP